MIDERTEHLISRKLDGELSEDEALELNKLLIRDPEARGLMEDYARMDRQVGEAVRAVLWSATGGAAPATSWQPPAAGDGTR